MSAEDPAALAPDEVPFEPLDGPAEDATVFNCPLCNARFTHGLQACPTCPLNAGCSLVTCPSCNYSFPRTSRLVSWLERINPWRARRRSR